MPPIVHLLIYATCAGAGWLLSRRSRRLATDPRLRRTWDELQGMGRSYDDLEVRVRAIHEQLDVLERENDDSASRYEYHVQRATDLEFERVNLQTALAEADARARQAEGVHGELSQAIESFLGSFRTDDKDLTLGITEQLSSLASELGERLGRNESSASEGLSALLDPDQVNFLGAVQDEVDPVAGEALAVTDETSFLRADVVQLEALRAELSARHEAELEELHLALEGASRALNSKESHITSLVEHIQELESKGDTQRLEAELEDLRSAQEKMEAEESALRRRLIDAEATLSETTIRSLDSELSATIRQREEQARTAEALAETRYALQAAEVERETREREVEVLTARVAELDATLEGMAQREAACRDLERRFEELETQRDQALSRARKLRTRLGDVRIMREELTEQRELCEQLDERCLSLEESRKRASAKNRVLRRELEDAREDLRRSGLDPDAWKQEREERLAEMEACMEAVRLLSRDLAQDERRHQRLVGDYENELFAREDEVASLTNLLAEVNDMCETADELVRSIERK